MSRLIDADMLVPDADYDDGDYWAVSMAQIHNAPTIEERKTGKWMDAVVGGTLPVIVCDQCNTFFPLQFGASHNFCPNCGAKMEADT